MLKHVGGQSLTRQPTHGQGVPARAGGIRFHAHGLLGKGSFGAVYLAVAHGDGADGLQVAIKSIKPHEAANEIRALSLLRGCPNVVELLGTFESVGMGEPVMNLVLEYVPDTLQRIIKHQRYAVGRRMDLYHVCVFAYQLFRALAALFRRDIIHRDIKPANILIEPKTYELKLCDFGASKLPDTEEAHNVYRCSRFYRAPELILSTPAYTAAVDWWSAGCVLAEMLIGQHLFAGKDGVDQFGQIVEVLGTPSPADFYAMNPQYDASVGFGQPIEPLQWHEVLGGGLQAEVTELVGGLLRYDPADRLPPLRVLAAAAFDGLRRATLNASSGVRRLVELGPEELQGCSRSLAERLSLPQA